MINPKYVFIIAILFSVGCSTGTPTNVPPNDLPTNIASSDLNMLGAYELTIDTVEMTADLAPKRNSSLGESWIVSGRSYFDNSPCRDCFRISGLGLEDERILIDFSIRHPFPKGSIYEPPSAKNRLDLDIFDLAMVVQRSPFAQVNFPQSETSVASYTFDNPNGFTNELAGVTGLQASLPYVLIIDDSATEPPSSTYNKFEMGADSEFEVKFPFTPGETLTFDLYLTFGYGYSATYETRLFPVYFNPEFNRKAAWKVEVLPPGTTPGSTWDDTDTTTLYDVTAKIYDWQINANVNPVLTHTTDIYAASDVAKVTLEIPGMHNAIKEYTSPESGDGTPSNPLIYKLSVANENALSRGEYTGLVGVYDERTPLEISENRDYLIHTSDGGRNRISYEIPEYVTYQTFSAKITESGSSGTGNLLWAKRAGGSDLDEASAITVLSDNSMVICGEFDGAATFGPGETNQTILHAVASSDVFVARYNPDGTLAWAKSAGGTYYEKCPGVTALSDDSIVITGYFYSPTITFGKGEANETTLNNHPGELDIFIARYNPNGTLAWAKSAGGSADDEAQGITALSDDSIVITGLFYEVATFGQGEPNQTTFNSPNGWLEIFIARYNPNGTLAWAKKAGGEGSDEGVALTSLSDDSIIVSGIYSNEPAVFGKSEPNETSLDPIGWYDIFIARYNPSGALEWAKRAGGEFDDCTLGMTTLSDNSIGMTGFFSSSATFGEGEPNETILATSGEPYNSDIFTARYNSDGLLEWAKGVWGESIWDDNGCDITALSDNSTVVTGFYRDSAIFALGEPNETNLVSAGENDMFIARYDSDGSLLWVKSQGGEGWEKGFGVTTLSDNSFAATGWFADISTFGRDEPNETILTAVLMSDIFIARFEQ